MAPSSAARPLNEVRLPLEEGRRLYGEHLGRPHVTGGVRASTRKRYKTVFDKFLLFAHDKHVSVWNDVTRQVLNNYAANLEGQGYKSKTLRNQLTTLGQAIRWLVQEGHLVGVDPPKLKLTNLESERAYRYERAEVAAMIAYCQDRSELHWLVDVIIGLACTGLRISELAALRWSDIDIERGMPTLTDETGHSSAGQQPARQLKSGRSRSLPLHEDLLAVLQRLPRRDARIFHGPRGGKLKPDTVRNILVREVIKPLVPQFPGRPGQKSFADGRLHSFRHYFASMCANQGTAERIAMERLGHADSEMVRHYYHLHDTEARQQMARLNLLGTAGMQSPGSKDEAATLEGTPRQHDDLGGASGS